MLAQRDDPIGRTDAFHALGELTLLIAGARARDAHEIGGEVVLLLCRHHTGVRRHRHAVHPGFERADDLALGPAGAVRAGLREVAAVDVPALGIDHLIRRGPDAAAIFAVALLALHFQIHGLAVDGVPRLAGGIRQRHGLERTRIGEARVERLDVLDERPALIVGQQVLPRRHARAVRAARDRAEQVVVGRQLASRRRPELELAGREIARRRDEERRAVAVALAFLPVALHTVGVVQLLALRDGRRRRRGPRRNGRLEKWRRERSRRIGRWPAGRTAGHADGQQRESCESTVNRVACHQRPPASSESCHAATLGRAATGAYDGGHTRLFRVKNVGGRTWFVNASATAE